jgi:hypothetical protein
MGMPSRRPCHEHAPADSGIATARLENGSCRFVHGSRSFLPRSMHAIQTPMEYKGIEYAVPGATGSPSMGVDDFAQRRGRSHEPIRRIERGGVCRRLPGNRSLAGAAKGEGPSFRAEGRSTGRWRKETLAAPRYPWSPRSCAEGPISRLSALGAPGND